MTDKIAIDRAVVEQALEMLNRINAADEDRDFLTEDEAVCTIMAIDELDAALRAALEQPQANQPAMTPIAQRKLDDLVASGYKISGYSVYHERKHQHGFVTGAGLVGWWKPEGVEYPQPQGEQEPVAWMKTWDSVGHARTGMKRVDLTPECETWLANMFPVITPLYTHPQPPRRPLTDEQIGEIEGWFSNEFGLEAKHSIDFARSIERAHGITGETK